MNTEREHMFEKVVTPSDVGKLNRLVIPKQYAERHFPQLGPNSSQRGTELCFEDRAGAQWRFRYCYWGSSQSYVITKGWSRFVRENRLEAGDTVLFSCDPHHGRFFIDFHHNRPLPPQETGSTGIVRPMGAPDAGPAHDVPYMFFDFSAANQTLPTVQGAPSEPRRGVRLFGVNLESDREPHFQERRGEREDRDEREDRI